jgi:O-antigen/teichoic acid export membrane protein
MPPDPALGRDARVMRRGLAVVGMGRVFSIVLGFFLLAWLGRRLGPESFGVLQFALAIMVYPTLLADLGLATVGLRDIASGRDARATVGSVLGARLALVVLSLGLVVAVVLLAPLDGTARGVLLILAAGLPASALQARWILQGSERYAAVSAVEVATVGFQLAGSVLLVHGPDDVAAAAVALTAAAWAATLVSLVLVGERGRVRPWVGTATWATIWRAVPLGAAAIAITIYYGLDTVLLGIFRGPTEVGYYAAAYRVILPILTLAGAVGTVALPRLASLQSRDAGEATRAAGSLAGHMVLAAAPLAVGGALVASPVISLVYGAAYEAAVLPFSLLVWSVLTVFANAAFAFLLLARGRDRAYVTATVAGAAANLGLNLLVIPVAGMVGAAITTIVSEITVLGLIVWATRDVSLRSLAAAVRTVILPVSLMAVAVIPIRDSLLAIPVGAIVYGSVLLGVKLASRRRGGRRPAGGATLAGGESGPREAGKGASDGPRG